MFGTMRKERLGAILFVLALAIQFLQPGARLAARFEQTDVAGLSAIICQAADGADRARAPQRSGHADHGACLFCQSFCDGVAPLHWRAVLTQTPLVGAGDALPPGYDGVPAPSVVSYAARPRGPPIA